MAKKKVKKTDQLSLAEFRAWLDGVREMQPDQWVPNADQWNIICEKIECITVDDSTLSRQSAEHTPTTPTTQYYPQVPIQPTYEAPVGTSSMDDIPIGFGNDSLPTAGSSGYKSPYA